MKKSWRAVALEAIVGVLLAFAVVRFVGHGFSWRSLPVGMTISVGLWVAFSVYWSIAARNSKPTQSSESVGSRQLHVLLVNGALLLLLLPVPGLTRRFLPESPALVVVGLAVQTAFLLFAVWARRHLGRNWSGEVRIATEHELVRSGPYKYIRHPIYTAILGMYIGTMLVSGEIHALIALAVVTLAYWRKIRMEERVLDGVFGESYEAYRRESWALVPPLL
jgi:protein-S-isoprenylcysteine O-methyltransferase Ste14